MFVLAADSHPSPGLALIMHCYPVNTIKRLADCFKRSFFVTRDRRGLVTGDQRTDRTVHVFVQGAAESIAL